VKHTVIAITLFCQVWCGTTLANDLDKELRRIAALEAELDPLQEPIIVHDASIRVFTNGQAVPFLVDTIMSQPPENRTLRFDMVDQKKPLMNSNGGALGCGWFVELNGRFWVTALGKSLDTRWKGHGKLVTDPVLEVATSIQPRGYVKPPPCPVYIKCRWTKKCRWGICVPWYECKGRILDCSKCSVGGGFEVLPPRIEFEAEIDYSGVEITARPLSAIEGAIVAAVGETPGISTPDLAAKISRPEPAVEAAAKFLKAAGLLDSAGGWTLRDGTVEAGFRPGGVILIDVVQPNVYYIINFRRCLDLPFNAPEDDPCLEIKEEFPSGRLATTSIVARQESEFPIVIEDTPDLVFDGPWKGRTVRTNVLASQFEATQLGLGLKALVRSRWSDVAAIEAYLKVHMLDTGNGEAIFVESPAADPVSDGRRMLVGAGSRQSIGRLVRHVERTSGLTPDARINYFVITHTGSDMLANAAQVVDRYDVETIIHPGLPEGFAFRRLLRKAADRGVRVVNLREEDIEIELGDNIEVDTLFSYDPSLPTRWWRRKRDASIVLKLTHGARTFLFTGDIGVAVEERLLTSGADLHSDVLKVADNGSDSASSAPFLAEVSPRFALISVRGQKGWATRPSPVTVSRLEAQGARVVSTGEGDPDEANRAAVLRDDIAVLSDGDTLLVYQFDPILDRWQSISR
jgi:beta-lactamase superfamily II metal-dependent hydrolase